MKFSCVILTSFLCFSAGAQTFVLFEPQASASAKTVVFLHGGAWISGSAAQDSKFGDEMKKAGLCAVLVDYGLAPAFMYPSQTKDLEAVLQKLKKEKSKKCDFAKLYLVGFSAGAHIIADWAAFFKNDSVKGFIGVSGIYDIPALAKANPDYVDWFIKKEFGAEKSWEAGSVSGKKLRMKAPWLLVHSKKDELVGTVQSQLFLKNLKNQKLKSDYLELESGSHGQTVVNAMDSIVKFVKEN